MSDSTNSNNISNMTYEQFCNKWFECHDSLYLDLLKTIAKELKKQYKLAKINAHCIFYFNGEQETFTKYEWEDGLNKTYVITKDDTDEVNKLWHELNEINNKYLDSFDQYKKDWMLYQKGEYTFEDDKTSDNKKSFDDIVVSMDIIPTSDIVEYAKGINFNVDGTYVLAASKTLSELMVLFMQWWQLVLTLVKSADIATLTKAVIDKASKSKDVVASVAVVSAKDYMGHVKRTGLTCPCCGKTVASLKSGGFCSTECANTYIKKSADPLKKSVKEEYEHFLETLDNIKGILNHTSLLLNALTGIPNIINELSEIPEPYKSYVLIKINEGYCLIYATILKLLSKKSELIKLLMKPIKLGFISKPLRIIFTTIHTLLNAMDLALEAFDAAYMAVYKVIEGLSDKFGGFSIDAESFAWAATPRSYMSPLPYTCPDSGKIFVNLPGGAGANKLEMVKALMPSGIQNMDFELIDKVILELFPPLFPVDYYLEPELFNIRYLFSDQSNVALLIRQQLEDLLTHKLDYMPKFENMILVKKKTIINDDGTEEDVWSANLGYVWFALGLLDSWAPHSKALTGSLLNPTI